ncbi:MAG TPA: hypothetical protein PKE26_11055 [Kiritimatiellia bacterium]|nr:hypothetical protein [Kiritimatiellia bacterium]HMO99637.1 hypothetical protein [Kiritimatiellia bacterium]HMP97116.1 hypothetical protein [Kiritimatiellia bacterium]
MNTTIISKHSIVFDFKGAILLDETARSLIALNNFSRRLPVLLYRTMPELSDLSIHPYLNSIEPGSEIINFFLDLGFGTKEERAARIQLVRKKLKLDEKQTNSPILTTFIYAALLASVAGTASYCAVRSKGPTIEIDLSHNSGVIQIGAEAMEVTPKKYASALKRTFKPSRALAIDTIDLLKPASSRNADVLVDGSMANSIKADIIATLPQEIPEKEVKEKTRSHDNVMLDLRATDFDKASSGWAAVIHDIAQKRLKMELAHDINPASLRGLTIIHADVDVLYRLNAAGDYIPQEVYLKAFRQ